MVKNASVAGAPLEALTALSQTPYLDQGDYGKRRGLENEGRGSARRREKMGKGKGR